jgi:PAS domain S-box-containing protein
VERMAANLGHALDRLDAQARLQQSEARFRSLASLSSDWFWEQDAELRFTWGSPGAEEERGAPVHGTLGMRRWEVPFYRPLAQSWEQHRAVLEARKPFRDFEYLRLDPGGIRYVSINGEPVFDAGGTFRGYRGTARDITVAKLAQLRMEQLTRMYAALSSANEAILRATSTRELLERACEVAVQSGDFTLGTVFLLDPASGLLRRGAASGRASTQYENLQPSIDPAAAGGQGLIGEACRARAAVVSNDYEADPRAAGRRQERTYRVGSAAVFPLLVDGELAGVFGLLHAERASAAA